MPPNLLVKAAFVRGEENFDSRSKIYRNGVRTDFILQNIYSYILGERYCYNPLRASNKTEEDAFKVVKKCVKSFQINYKDTVKNLCSEIEVTEETVDSVLMGVSNELFCEGITWSRLITLFVFVGELTILCISTGLQECVVDDVYECFSRLVKEKLESWVYDHGGWEGFSTLSTYTQDDKAVGWTKTILHSIIRLIGTVSHMADYSNPYRK